MDLIEPVDHHSPTDRMNESSALNLLSGGAAQGLVAQLQAQFQTEFQDQGGCTVAGSYGAVGVMKDRLLAGEACDAIILTEALIGQLTAAVCAGARHPEVARALIDLLSSAETAALRHAAGFE